MCVTLTKDFASSVVLAPGSFFTNGPRFITALNLGIFLAFYRRERVTWPGNGDRMQVQVHAAAHVAQHSPQCDAWEDCEL